MKTVIRVAKFSACLFIWIFFTKLLNMETTFEEALIVAFGTTYLIDKL